MANVRVTGTSFLTATDGPVDRMVLDGSLGPRSYYDPSGPNTGLTEAGATVLTWTETTIEVNDPALDGETITDAYVSDVDVDYNVAFDVVPDINVLTYPLLEGICSPAADTIRFEGQRFLTATAGPVGYVITRLLDYGTVVQGPFMQYELADGSPDANGWSLVTHTDNVIEISNPAFTSDEPIGGPGDFVVNGVAFHDPTATSMYYYEPWGDPSPYSAPVDGAGCPDLVVSYDGITGTLSISSASGQLAEFFGNLGGLDCATMGIDGTHSISGAWTNVLNPWDMTSVTANLVTLDNAWSFLGLLPGETLDLTHLEVYSANCAPISITTTWDGSVLITEP